MTTRFCTKLLVLLASFSPLAAQGIGGTAGIGGNAGIGGPAPFAASDNFPGSSLSANWTVANGSFTIASNTYTGNGGSGSSANVAFWSASSAPNNQFSQAKFVVVGTVGNAGVIVRAQATGSQGYFMHCNGSNPCRIYRVANGPTYTQIGTDCSGGFPVAGDIIKIDIQGTTITGYKNGILLTGCTGTDATYATGKPGIWGQGNSGSVTMGTWSAGTP